MMRFFLFAVLLALTSPAFAQHDPAEKDSSAPAVDIELVLAADVSYSMNKDLVAIRREAYAQAIVSREFLEALKASPSGRLAVTYFEWSGSDYQKILVPWRVIDGPETAAAVAAELANAPAVHQSRSSISGAIKFAMSLFDSSPYRGSRRVVEISGDGPNNSGEFVEGVRDAALAKGITINGLPIMLRDPARPQMYFDDLDLYYEDCVTGGPGASVMTIKDRDKFKEVIQAMLVSEVAGRAPGRPNVQPAEKEKRISCVKGEKAYDSIWSKPSGTSTPPKAESSDASPFTAWQQAEFIAHTKKCFRRHKERIRGRVDLSVTIGPNGMIIGDPGIISPVDSDEFRRDVRLALERLHRCEPFIVDPFGKTRVRFTQVFKFGSEEPDANVNAAILANFRKCWSASRTGPAIWIMLSYKPDGKYASSPFLINPENTAEYSRNATQVMRQITKCPPVKFPKGKYPAQSVRWQFPSHESAKASRSGKT